MSQAVGYGITHLGGAGSSGTVFKMTIGGKITTLYSFCVTLPCTDGDDPVGLMQAANGNLYGTTYDGGSSGNGAIFEITTSGMLRTLYSFCSKSNCTDGSTPFSAPMQASNGNLYGTTYNGGAHSNGVVYEITPSGQFKTLHNFCAQANCADGAYPQGGLTQDSKGNLYGTTYAGGTGNLGTVFEITTDDHFVTLHTFNGADGGGPQGAIIRANDGNLYGTTSGGGTSGGGTIFEITSEGVFSSLASLCGISSCAGLYPICTLFQATNGVFYGTAFQGGTGGYGIVFSYSNGLSPLVETVPTAGKVGKRVIILGNGLTGTTSVTFNGTPAAFAVESDTYITTTVPTGAATGTVSVATPTGTLYSNPPFRVTK